MSKTLHLVSRLSDTSPLDGLLTAMANEKKLELGLHLPVRAASSCSNVVEEFCSRIEQLAADLENFASAATDRNGPALVSFCRPIRGDDRGRQNVPPALEVVKNEPVDGHLILMFVVDSCEFIANKSPSQQMAASEQSN